MTLSKEMLSNISVRLNKFIFENEIPMSDELGQIVDDIWAASCELLERRERDKQEPVAGADECDREVFEKGKSACLVAISKVDAETICRGISAATGCKVDWHYVGGRVHIKALYAAPPAPVVPDECVDKQAICWMRSHSLAGNYRDGWNACRAAGLNQTHVKQPARNSPVTPDGWIKCSERLPASDGNYWGWWSESKRQGPVWFIKSQLQAQFQSSEITHWMPLPAAPKQESL